MRPSGPTESDQQVSESGLRENGYHLTGYGVSAGDSASASKAGTRFAVSAVLPILRNVRRSISCPELIHSSVVDQKPGDYIPDVDESGIPTQICLRESSARNCCERKNVANRNLS